MNKLIYSVFFCIVVTILGCSLFTAPEIDIIGITETDELGGFIGNIDEEDWSPVSYENVFFGKNIWIYPSEQIFFSASSIGQIFNKSFRIYNFSNSEVALNSTISIPFICEPVAFNLNPSALLEVNINYVVDDTSSHYDLCKINTNVGDSFTIPVNAPYRKIIVISNLPYVYSMLPAFPNPANHIMNFTFRIPKSDNISLYVKDNSGDIVKWILREKMLPTGTHDIAWDITEDNISSGEYRVFLEAGNFSEAGDIKIIK